VLRSLPLALAAAFGLAACGPGTTAKPTPKAALNTPPPSILGKMKEPVGLARQVATITSIHDMLPVAKASNGMSSLRAASSLIANNGAALISEKGTGIISDNAGGWNLLQAFPMSLLPDYVKVRQDGVLHQVPDGLLSAMISLYDAKQYDPHPGADNEPFLIDRFHMDVASVDPVNFSFDLDLKVISSRRIPFVDKLTLRETGRQGADGGFVPTKMEYLVSFAQPLLDGAKDQADLRLVANAEDLIQTEGASFEARRMDVLGSNGHGDYVGEASFLPGGDIACTCTHTRTDGAVTKGTLTIHTDGSNEETAESAKGQVRLEAKTDADGKMAVQLRDLAQADTPLIPIDVSIADGVAVFDLGNGEKGRARVK
jgi:hypothetical protein